ncbi:hypothetical protein KY386_01700 [Candidatus Parcubacteria bacterium]|nr:hypothetical protein [Candidatus Parcubacteria bacterium]
MHVPELLTVVLVWTAEHLENYGPEADRWRRIEGAVAVVGGMTRNRPAGLLCDIARCVKRLQCDLELQPIDLELVLRGQDGYPVVEVARGVVDLLELPDVVELVSGRFSRLKSS